MDTTHTYPIASAADRMTPEQTAELLGTRVQTLAAWRCTGRHSLPYTRIGSRIVYSRASVMAWLTSRTGTSVAQLAAAM